MSVPPWQCCPPPLKSCRRSALHRRMPHSSVWPTRASPQTGLCPGRWPAAAASVTRRAGAPCCWRRTASTAGAAPWGSLQSSGRRWALWPVRPNRAPRLQSYRNWGETSVSSTDLTDWDWANILTFLHSVCFHHTIFSVSFSVICLNKVITKFQPEFRL